MTESSRHIAHSVATDSERRPSPSSRMSNPQSEPEHQRKSNRYEKKKRNHLHNLRNITARLLREESEIRTTSVEGSVSNEKTGKDTTKSKYRAKSIGMAILNNKNIPEPFQKLKPWMESTRILAEAAPWDEAEASPIEIVTMKHQSDSMTEHTALCSAFEMLSFEYFCNGGQKSPSQDPVIVPATPFKVVGHLPAEDDGFVVPREIIFENHHICGGWTSGVGCASMPLHDEEPRVNKKHKNKHAFIKRFLPFKPHKSEKKTRVMKVKVYVDTPSNMGSNRSVGNSTLTMPKELIRNSTNTTI